MPRGDGNAAASLRYPSRQMHLALATATAHPQLLAGDEHLVAACAPLGVRVAVVPWDDPDVEWGAFDRVLPRVSGVFPRPDEWWDWVDEQVDARRLVGELGGKLGVYGMGHNRRLPIHGVRGFIAGMRLRGDRVYAVEPLQGGVQAPRFLTRPDLPGHYAVLRDFIGRLGGRWQERPVEPRLYTDGELSLMLFGGRLSHAVRRVPAPGTAATSPWLGARVEAVVPSVEVAAFAESMAPYLDTCCTRLDVFVGRDGPRIMEATGVDAELFFDLAPAAAARLVIAIRDGQPEQL